MGSATRIRWWFQAVVAGLVCMGAAVANDTSGKSAENRWRELFQRNPYPYTTPLPAEMPTAVDGVYVKCIKTTAQPIPCRRCPDYKPEGGLWKLSLRRGVFRIFHTVSGWRSIGTFLIIGDRILLVNDPVCPSLTGVYRWKLLDGNITFSAVEDRCSAGLRAQNFSNPSWRSCKLSLPEAAASDHRPKPDGCDQP